MKKTDKPSASLQNVANLSQVLLVALAFFGYFYTVRPIYQKDLLEEEIARKEIELKNQQDSLRQIKHKMELINSEKDDLNNRIEALRLENKKIYLANEKLKNNRELLSSQIKDKEGQLFSLEF